MGSGCTKKSVKVAPMPEPECAFYVANATRNRIVVITANNMSDFSSDGIQAKLKADLNIPFVNTAEFDLTKGNVSEKEAFTQRLGIGQYAKFSAKYYAIYTVDAEGKQQMLVKDCATGKCNKSLIVTDSGVVTSAEVTNRDDLINSNCEVPANVLEKKVWISAADGKDLRPREFFVANASGYSIYVLPSIDPMKVSDFSQYKDQQRKEVQYRKTWTFRGDRVVIFDKDNTTEICEIDVKPRQSVVVFKQSKGDYRSTLQLEGDDIEGKKWIVDGKSYAPTLLGKGIDAVKSYIGWL